METFIEKSSKNNTISNFKNAMLLIMLTVLSSVQCMAESNSFVKTKEELEHQTTMSYVYMIVGFVAIIAIAWFSVKKKTGENQTHNHPPVPHHHHSIHDKRYGTHHAK
jgi:heme/copper-type cytochrome/quinol oxidase subunit 2